MRARAPYRAVYTHNGCALYIKDILHDIVLMKTAIDCYLSETFGISMNLIPMQDVLKAHINYVNQAPDAEFTEPISRCTLLVDFIVRTWPPLTLGLSPSHTGSLTRCHQLLYHEPETLMLLYIRHSF